MRRFLAGLALLALAICAPAQAISPAEQIIIFGGNGNGSGNVPVQLSVPAGFNWTPTFHLFKTPNGTYSTDYNITSCIPTVAKTYYVNAVTGASGNPGTPASPLHTIAQAFAKSDVDQVIVQLSGTQAANGGFISWNGAGWSGTTPTRSVSVIADAGGRVILASSPAAAAPTWTSVGSNTYSTPLSGSTLGAPTDLHHLDGNGFFQHLTPVASEAAVMATPGSYFYDGTAVLYAQASDSRNLVADPYMTGGYQAQIGAFNTAAAITLYAANLDFVGGYPFLVTQPSAPTGAFPTLCMNGTSHQGGTGSTADGFTVNGGYNVFINNIAVAYNNDDGLGGHVLNGVAPFWFDVGTKCGFNGYSTGGSNQCFSIHDTTEAISLNPNFGGSENQTIRNITSSQQWVLGGSVGCPIETDLNGQTVSVQGNSQIWLDGTAICQQSLFTLDSENTSTIFGRNTLPTAVTSMTHTAGTGTITNY